MDLRDFYRLILRNLSLVLISTFIGTFASGLITYLQTPMYQSEIQLFVSTQSGALDVSALIQGSSFSQQRVKSYAQIINSPTTLQPVIDKLNIRDSASGLAARVKANAPLDTVLINVRVQDKSAYLSARIANEIGRQFSSYVNELESNGPNSINPIKVSLVKEAQRPSTPSSPKPVLNLLLGLLLGFGLGVSLAVLRQVFDTSIKNEEDLDGASLLGTIGFDKSAKSKPLITQINRYASRTEAFRQLRTNLEYLSIENPPKVIAVTSALPGEGKTTTSINLALSLANTGFKVLLIDADLRRPKVGVYLRLEITKQGMAELLSDSEIPLSQFNFQNSITTFEAEAPIDVLIAGKLPKNPAEILNSDNFSKILELARANYHFVIVDCPPGLPVADAAIITTRTDGALIVVEAGKTRKNEFVGIRDAILNVGGNVLGVVLNKIPYSRVYDDYGYKYGYGYGYRYGYRGK